MKNPLAFGEQGDFYISFGVRILWDTNCIRFGKAGAHPQLALGIAIAPETLCLITAFFYFKGNCDSVLILT